MDGLIVKKTNDLYNDILEFSNALKMFKIIKKNCKNKSEVYNFEMNLNQNILDILNKLKNLDYQFDKYRIFLIKEPKYRLIMSEKVSDKIVNHLVAKYILLNRLESSLIDSNVATRYNKGSAYAFKLFTKYIRKLLYFNKDIYVLKIDINKYFYNIDHDILIKLIKKKIKDKNSIKIIKDILNTTNEPYVNKQIKNVINKEIKIIKSSNISSNEKQIKQEELEKIPIYFYNKGLPIGNMTSQILAVYYLNEVDHFIKEKPKHKNYIRYMDDLIILSTDKKELINSFYEIKNKLKELKLNTNKKSNIYNLKNGVSFLGYTFKTKNNKIIIRYNSQTIKRIRKKLKKLKIYNYDKYLKSKGSYKGYLEKSNTSLYKILMEKI